MAKQGGDDQSKENRENIYLQSLKETEAGRLNDANEESVEESSDEIKVTTSVNQEKTEPGSLGKVKSEFDKKRELHEQNREQLGKYGFRKIDNNNLPSQGKFNHPSMRLKIKAATVEAIKHYSSLDDTDLLDVSDHINEIINTCCVIEYEDRIGKPDDLMEADKYYVLLSIRDLTMDVEQKFNKLWQRCQCPKCGKKSDNEITAHAFSSYTIPKNIMKYYDAEKRKIVINDEGFGEPLMIAPPSVGVTKAIQKYMQDHVRKQQQAGQPIYFDPKFTLKLQYLVDSASQINEGFLKNLQKKINDWTPEKTIAFEYVRDNMDVGVRPQLELICRDTKSIDSNEEVGCKDDFSFTAPVYFRDGWRSVLDISGVIGRLFNSDSE